MTKIKYQAIIEEGPKGTRVILYKRVFIFWRIVFAGTRWLSSSYFTKYKVEKEYIEHWKKLYGNTLLIEDHRK